MLRRSAFSLIEALIAVLVLGLALLGVAAIFPAVVAEQRAATDRTAGVLALDAAEATITSHDKFNFTIGRDSESSGLESWRRGFIDQVPPSGWSVDGEWIVADDETIRTVGGSTDPSEYLAQGDFLTRSLPLSSTDQPLIPEVTIPIAARLWPAPYTGATGEPRYVWDFVSRRVLGSNGFPSTRDDIEIAIFVRRIDPNIPVPRVPRSGSPELGATLRLSDVLLGAGPTPARFAVGERSATDPDPTRDGSGDRYSPIHALDLEEGKAAPAPDILPIDPANSTEEVLLENLARFGQTFIDSQGKIFTVTGADPQGLRISPPLTPTEQADVGETLRRIIFTTQTPIAVRIVRISP